MILLLGSLLSSTGLGAPGWAAGCSRSCCCSSSAPSAVLLVAAGLRTSRPRREPRFVAWFGVRGVGTLYYAATVVDRRRAAGGEETASSCGRRSPA